MALAAVDSFDNVLTTNYSFEIEQALGIKNSVHLFRRISHQTIANYRDTERCFADYDAITYPVGERIIEGLFGNKKAWQNEEYYEERKLLIKYGQKKKKIFIPKTS